MFSRYFRQQGRSAAPVDCPDPLKILDKIQMQEKWDPILSETSISWYNICSLLQLETPTFKQLEDDATEATQMSLLSGLLGITGLGTTGTRGRTVPTNV